MMQSVHNMQKVVDRNIVRIDKYMFHLERDFLGEGTFGRVYKAQQTQTGQVVAIKVINLEQFKTSNQMKQLLKTEILVMMKLQNEHVVRILDVVADQYDMELFIVLEFCTNGDMRNLLDKHKRLTEQQATEILGQLLEGFQELVYQGYIHRDIKPENCLVNNKVFKVADFGFAAKIDITGQQRLRDCVGTPLYMAPQLLERQPYGAKCDIWSIGLMYYEMICGRPPWPCLEMQTYLEHIKTCPLRFPFNLAISSNAKDFIKQCLTIDEASRLSWEQIFKHPLFYNYYNKSQQPKQQHDHCLEEHQTIHFSNNEKKVLADLQERCQQNGQNPQEQLKLYQKSRGFKRDQFAQMLQRLDPNFTNNEAFALFKKFDLNGDGTVSAEEFFHIFCEFDFSDDNDNSRQILINLRGIINQRRLNLNELFSHFNQNRSGILSQDEFQQLIRAIAPKLDIHTISQLFQKFDKDGDLRVSLDEIFKALSFKQQSHKHEHECDTTKGNRVFFQLQTAVRNKQLNLQQLFQKFSNQGNSSAMDIHMFSYMVLRVDQSLNGHDVEYLFALFDNDKNGQLSFQEFYQRLMY